MQPGHPTTQRARRLGAGGLPNTSQTVTDPSLADAFRVFSTNSFCLACTVGIC